MLDVALNFLTAELNSYLLARGARKATDEVGKAEVGRLVDDAGKWAIPDDHIGVTLVHVEEERVLRDQLPETVLSGGRQVVLPPKLKLNLHVLFAAKFQKYDESLRALSSVLTLFQARPTFTQDAYPALEPRIASLKQTGPLASLHDVIRNDWTVDQKPELFCFGLLEAFDVPQLRQLVGAERLRP